MGKEFYPMPSNSAESIVWALILEPSNIIVKKKQTENARHSSHFCGFMRENVIIDILHMSYS